MDSRIRVIRDHLVVLIIKYIIDTQCDIINSNCCRIWNYFSIKYWKIKNLSS